VSKGEVVLVPKYHSTEVKLRVFLTQI